MARVPSDHRDSYDHTTGAAVPKAVTVGLIGVVILASVVILGYAVHVSRPAGGLPSTRPGPPVGTPGNAVTGPVIPGLHNDHPLSTHQVGHVLIAELNCIACHADAEMPLRAKRGPDLADAGTRIDPAFMRRFIADPAAATPGTTMPHMLAGRPAEERESVAADITAFLVDMGQGTFQRAAPGAEDTSAGHDLFHAIGCVACHPARDTDGREVDADGTVPLGHVPSKYGLA